MNENRSESNERKDVYQLPISEEENKLINYKTLMDNSSENKMEKTIETQDEIFDLEDYAYQFIENLGLEIAEDEQEEPIDKVMEFLRDTDESVLEESFKNIVEQAKLEAIVQFDELDYAIERKRRYKRINKDIMWGITQVAFVASFYLIFILKMTFLQHIVFLTSMWICVSIVSIHNYFVLKDKPPYVHYGGPIIRTL